jgi:hypothetical protein
MTEEQNVCCDPNGYKKTPSYECEACGGPVDAGHDTTERCYHSAELCAVCKWAPCDGGCETYGGPSAAEVAALAALAAAREET